MILITGAHGLLGSRLVPLLRKRLPGRRLIVIGRNSKSRSIEDEDVELLYGDLRDPALWAALPPTITHVFHLAGFIPWKAEDRTRACVVTDNLTPIANLIEHARRWPELQQVIYSSSVSVYASVCEALTEESPRQPVSLYGAAKLAGEELLATMESGGVKCASLRFSSLYARGQYPGTVLPLMVERARRRASLSVYGDGSRTQDFVHCDDAARALWLCLEREARGAFNVGSGSAVTMATLAETVSRVFAGGSVPVEYQTGVTESDPGIRLDIGKARRELGYDAGISLEEGLRRLKKEMED